MLINRRQALAQVTWLIGGVLLGADLFLKGCTRTVSPRIESLFNPDVISFLGDVADTILPPTNSPGAKEAGVGEFMPIMVRDCYTITQQQAFVEGLDKLKDASIQRFGREFQTLNSADRTELLNMLDKEAKEYQKTKNSEDFDHYFHLIKQLTLLGYFTSEIGVTQALRYIRVPGFYDGNYSYKKGDRAWAV